MISIAKYQTEYDNDEQVYFVKAIEILICSACGCPDLIKKGWRRRNLILIIGTLIVLMVRRVKCKRCNRIHHVLPDIVVPYKRYDAETIEKIIEGNQDVICCEESTINRIKTWWTEVQSYVVAIATTIEKCKIPVPVMQKSKLSQIVCILANSDLWPSWSRCKDHINASHAT